MFIAAYSTHTKSCLHCYFNLEFYKVPRSMFVTIVAVISFT